MRNHTSLKKNALSLLIMQVINYLVPLITLPYLARTLGIVQYGALNLSLSLIQYGVIFITERIVEQLEAEIAIYDNALTPAIIPIPSSSGTLGIGMARLHKNVEQAIGMAILQED